jgi:hypothetical protein
MPPDPDFTNPEAEYRWLTSLTPGQRTPDRTTRELQLKTHLLSEAARRLHQQYDLPALQRLPPDHDLCYQLLRVAADVRLPEDPAILSSMSSNLYLELNNLRANVDCYRAAAAETATVLARQVDMLKAFWATVCPLDEKFRRDAVFEHEAAAVLDIQAKAQALSATAETVRWSLLNHITTIDRVLGRNNRD